MKKLLILLFILIAAVCVFASCGDEEGEGATTPSANNNTTTSSVVSGGNANCAHDFKVTNTVNATCAADGKEISTCSKCGATSEKTLSKTNDHTMKYEETEPTCSLPGKVIGKCEVCEHTVETDGKPALGHSGKTFVTEVETEPTCTEPGKQKQICSDCGEEQWSSGFSSEIPAIGHTYERGDDLFSEEAGVTYVEAQCGVDGYFNRVCKDCGYDKEPITREMYKNYEGKPGYNATKYDEMEAWEHTFGKVPNDILEPTCQEPGYLVFYCMECGTEKKDPQGSKNNHQYVIDAGEEGKHFVTNPMPTCVSKGTRTYICTECNEPSDDPTYIVDVPELEHDTSKHTNEYLKLTVKATCTESAYKIYSCCNGDCDQTERVDEGSPLGHDLKRNGEVSCATGGKTPYKCTRCKEESLVEDEFSIPFEEAKHQLGDMVVDPTCVSDAVYVCSLCNSEYPPYEGDEEYADGFAHNRHHLVFFETVAPTCGSVGYNLYKCDDDEACQLIGKSKDINNLDTPIPADIVPRLTHEFVTSGGIIDITPDGKLTCKNCSLKYRDVKTEEDSGSQSLCLANCEGECKCGLIVAWTTYIAPKDLEVLNANEKVEKTSTTWSDGRIVPLQIGEGAIVISGSDETNCTVEIYDTNGVLVHTFEETGAKIYIDLYEYSDVSKVCITSSTKAVVRYCQIVE